MKIDSDQLDASEHQQMKKEWQQPLLNCIDMQATMDAPSPGSDNQNTGTQ